MTKKSGSSKKQKSKLAKAATKSINRKKRIPTIIFLVVIAAALILYFAWDKISPKKTNEGSVKGYTAINFVKQGELSFTNANGKFISKIDIEIADDDAKRANGMMYRSKNEENQGMLFIFEEEGPQSFWMHNTVLPLDIIYVNANNEIVNIHKNTTPFSDQSYRSAGPAQFVVEVNSGYCDKYGIEAGDKVVWRRL